MRFLSSGSIHQLAPFGPLFTLLNFFRILSEFAELFDFKIRTALWATADNQIFFEQTKDLKVGWCMPSLLLFIYICLFSSTVPLKDMTSF
jgi:hypothetical protein